MSKVEGKKHSSAHKVVSLMEKVFLCLTDPSFLIFNQWQFHLLQNFSFNKTSYFGPQENLIQNL